VAPVVVLIVLVAALGVVVAVLGIALVGARRDRVEAAAAFAAERGRADAAEEREVAAVSAATSTARELAEAEARAEAERQRAADREQLAADAEARATAALDDHAAAVEREHQLRAQVIELTAEAAVLDDALEAAGRSGGRPELIEHLWSLELGRVDREWRVAAAQVHAPDPPLAATDDGAFGRALEMELDRLLEEVGAPVVLRTSVGSEPDPATALLALRVAQELVAVAARQLDAVDLVVTIAPDGATTVTVCGEGDATASTRLAQVPAVAPALAALHGTLTVTNEAGRVQATATVPGQAPRPVQPSRHERPGPGDRDDNH
jgi:hypothetical protein